MFQYFRTSSGHPCMIIKQLLGMCIYDTQVRLVFIWEGEGKMRKEAKYFGTVSAICILSFFSKYGQLMGREMNLLVDFFTFHRNIPGWKVDFRGSFYVVGTLENGFFTPQRCFGNMFAQGAHVGSQVRAACCSQ